MSNAFESMSDDGGTATAFIEAGGQIYPKAARKQIQRKQSKSPVGGSDTGKQLSDQIREQLHARFVMNIDDAKYTDNSTLLEDYRYDIGTIRKACDDVCDVLKLLYRLNTLFDFQLTDEDGTVATDDEAMRDQQYLFWSKGLNQAIMIGDYALSTRLTNLLEKNGPQALKQKREECLENFIGQLCRLLDEMLEDNLIGLVVFGKDRDCDFHFFRELVVDYKSGKQTVRDISSRRVVSESSSGRDIELTGVQFDLKETTSKVHRTRQDNYLRDVTVARFGDSRMPIPANVHQFITLLPEWLQNSVCIVEGDRYSQQFFDYEIEHAEWEKTNIRPFHSLVIERTYTDPALTLGHYVLTGWDTTDVDEQRDQQKSNWKRTRDATGAAIAQSYSSSMLLAAGISLVVTMLVFGLLPESLARFGSAIGMSAFIGCAIGWFHCNSKAFGKKLNGVHYTLAGILAMIFAASILCIMQALRSDNWSMLWFGLAAPIARLFIIKLSELLPDDR